MQVTTQNITVPKLRFMEFDDNWRRKNLSNFISELKSGISVNSDDIKCKENEFGNWLRYS